MKNCLAALSAILIAIMLAPLVAGTAFALPIEAVSYDMLNGKKSSYEYFDESYIGGSGPSETSYAQLSGGLGDLTDEVIAKNRWYVDEAPSGAGPYVGWTINPTITFHFRSEINLSSVTIYLDDPNGDYNVYLPTSVDIGMGGVTANHIIVDPPSSIPVPFTFTDLGLSGDTLTLTLNRKNNTGWVFLSEVTFDDGTTPQVMRSAAPAAVPEPGTLLLLGAGLFGLACYRKRRRAGN